MPNPIIQLRVSVDDEVYRDIEISGDASLYKLAEVINNVFGFDFDHAFGFYDNQKNLFKSKEFYELFKDMGEGSEGARSVKKTRVAEAFERNRKVMIFLFDYGDGWTFHVKRTGSEDRAAPKAFWKLTKSVGDAPPQYPDYEEEDDGKTFDEKYEIVDMGGIKVAKLREKK
jgi:hypothetical protein